MATLTKKVTFGAIWMVCLRLSIRFIGLLSTLLLVRLLDPSDFGIVAMAMTIVGTIELLTAFGFDVVLIQDQSAGPDEYNTAWTLNVSLGAGSAILLALLAYPAAGFYGEPELVPVFWVLALASFFQGLENIGLVDFRKHLEFHKEFVFRIIVKLLGFTATISLALMLRTYWALVIGVVFSQLASTIFSYYIHPFRPRLTLVSLGKIFNFSKWLFINNILFFVRHTGPNFIIGKLVGSTGLGLYTVSYEISNLPTTELIAPINRALFPGFSKISSDQERSRTAFVQAASVLCMMSLPVGFGIAATAELFTPVILGDKWIEAIPIIKILAIFGAIGAVQSPIGTVLLALGRPRLLAILAALNATILIPFTIVMAANNGAKGAALALLLTFSAFLPVYYGFAASSLGLTIRDLRAIFGRPTVATILMYFVVSHYFGSNTPAVLSLLFAVVSGAIVYVVSVFVLWNAARRPSNSAETYILDLAYDAVAKIRTR